jgi:hypothetical protein
MNTEPLNNKPNRSLSPCTTVLNVIYLRVFVAVRELRINDYAVSLTRPTSYDFFNLPITIFSVNVTPVEGSLLLFKS